MISFVMPPTGEQSNPTEDNSSLRKGRAGTADAMTRTFGDRLDFPGLFDVPSWCWLEVWEAPGRPPVVIATNPARADSGTSVTNAAEPLATLVCRRFGLEPRALVWIECYERAPGDPHVRELSPLGRSDFDRVYFDVAPDGTLMNPDWKPFGRAAAEALVGEKL